MQELNSLLAITPLDGRYRSKIRFLENYFSEYALLKYRLKVEIEYLISLSNLGLKGKAAKTEFLPFTDQEVFTLRSYVEEFSINDAIEIKNIENKINHDVKALEYFLRDKINNDLSFDQMNKQIWKRYIHWGLTSQDINNTAIPYTIKEFLRVHYVEKLNNVISYLNQLSVKWKDIPMPAYTHGQPATPTILGKEVRVFEYRLNNIIRNYNFKLTAKLGGATGGLNAHYFAFPHINWIKFCNDFVSQQFGLERQQFTTQIDSYDSLAELFNFTARINTILLDLAKDFWSYISMGYFKLKVATGEVGSSAMPHKVNPIDFENAEGNLGMANSLFIHLAEKLPISRLQRDLTDSTVLRNIGVPFGYTMQAFDSLLKGLSKIDVDIDKINLDLNSNYSVLAEAIQCILKREGIDNAYELLKEFTRTGQKVTQEMLIDFSKTLSLDDSVLNEILQLSPHNYGKMIFGGQYK